MAALSEFYRQHHDVEAPQIDTAHFRPAWRVHTQLDRLLAQRAIARSEHDCAVAFRHDLELVLASAYPAPPELGVPRGHCASQMPPMRFDAQTRINQVQAALGPGRYELLRLVLIDDPSWTVLGVRLRIDPRTARAWAIRAIKRLGAVERA